MQNQNRLNSAVGKAGIASRLTIGHRLPGVPEPERWAKINEQTQCGGISRKLIIWLSIPVVVIGLLFGGWSAARYITGRERAHWKTGALERLATLSIANKEISQELETLKAGRGAAGERQQWAGEHVLLMTNGEYIVYEYRHGRNDYFPPHLFLGHCSDGRWLYSSYHFCNSMAMVQGDDPPGSIAEFAKAYSTREFDGKSDECLKMTN
jgi:hypothetical protein